MQRNTWAGGNALRVLTMGAMLIALICVGCTRSSGTVEPPPQNIVLFIGDGMGAAHRMAAQWASVGRDGRLAMDNMPHAGTVRTRSADSPVTDSAAAATAMATGAKTNNGTIAMDAALTPLETILETARRRGKSVGLVTTTPIAHATPAAFAAHVASRNEMSNIAAQMASAGVDVLLGGGENAFLPHDQSGCYPGMGDRTDGRQLIEEMAASGYTFVCRAEELKAVDTATTPKLLGLFADDGMVRPFAPTLAELTATALAILSRDKDGFFLLVEGGQIDWAAHQNDAAHVIADVLGLNDAVQVAQRFAASRPSTLIIIVADHETGGMQISPTAGRGDSQGPFDMPDGGRFFVRWTTTDHTGQNVPVTAQGPYAARFDGEMDNTDIYHAMRSAMER